MENQPDFCDSLTNEQNDDARRLLETVAAKWPMAVLYELVCADQPLRFSRVMDRVDGISQKVLTQTLRALERYNLISRTVFPEVPPRVEYQVNELGKELQRQFVPVWQWIAEHLDQFRGIVPDQHRPDAITQSDTHLPGRRQSDRRSASS